MADSTVKITDATYTATIDDQGYVIGYRDGIFSRWKISELQGKNGTDGSKIWLGTGAPDDILGSDGDTYINLSNYDLYRKANYVWGSPVGSIKGIPGTNGISPNEYIYSFSGTLSARTGKLKKYINNAHTITKIVCMLYTAPTGSSIKLDILKNGISHAILSSEIEIPIGQTDLTITSIDSPSLSAGDYLTLDIKQVGSTVSGTDLSIAIIME